MKNLILILVLLSAGIPALGQERQAGIQALLVNSPGTGNTLGMGAKGDVVAPLNEFFTALAEVSWIVEPKAYLGNGHAFRGRADLRYHPHTLHPFWIGSGVAVVHQRTSEYTKTAVFPTASAGINLNNRMVVGVKRYFQEAQTLNKVSAWEVQGDVFIPFNDTRWLVRIGGGATRTRFYQPWGSLMGWQASWAPSASAGFAWRF